VAIALGVTLFFFSGRSRQQVRPQALVGATAADPAAIEAQAMALYQAAVEYYRSGRIQEATTTLQQVVSLFPLTSGGANSRVALDQIQRGQTPLDPAPTGTVDTTPITRPPTEAPPPTDPPKKKPFVGIRRNQAGGETQPPESGDSRPEPAASPGPPFPRSTLAKTKATPLALPDGFVAVAESGVDASGWSIEIICLKDQSHMMLVPAGDFSMGTDNGAPNARPSHRVRLKTYYIDRYEITLMQYKHFLEQRRLKNNPYRDLSPDQLALIPTEHHPVIGVAWRDANAYADWSGKSLPTEAQWEKAARGSDGRDFSWGTGSPTWDKPRQRAQVDRVGSFAWDVSPFGCFDMAGNAQEWCADWYDASYYVSSPAENPEGPRVAPPPVTFRDPEKVIRGGSTKWEVTWRGYSGILEEPMGVGFRCVLELEPAAPRLPQGVVTESPRQPPAPPPARIPPGGYKF
jgi:formylglycine-generating enzyme required for sulfatase activity